MVIKEESNTAMLTQIDLARCIVQAIAFSHNFIQHTHTHTTPACGWSSIVMLNYCIQPLSLPRHIRDHDHHTQAVAQANRKAPWPRCQTALCLLIHKQAHMSQLMQMNAYSHALITEHCNRDRENNCNDTITTSH